MPITAKSNYGTKISVKASGNTFSEIEGVNNIPAIELEQEKIEVTHHASGGFREYIPSGLADPGDYSFEMRVDRADTVQQTLYTAYKAGTKLTFQILYPNGFGQQFDAYVNGFTYNEADATNPDGINATVSLAISGEVEDIEDSL